MEVASSFLGGSWHMKYGDEQELHAQVISLLNEGKRDIACTVVLQRYGPSLRGHLRGLIGIREAADDRYQDLCMALFSYLGRFGDEIPLRCWLFRKAHDLYVDWCRRHSRRMVVRLDSDFAASLQAPSQTSDVRISERERLLKEAFQALDETDRELLVLRTERAFSFREVADTLRIKELTARQRFQRIKAQLRGELVAK